jgi:DNA (cytosine-5)-methyltransferase 1
MEFSVISLFSGCGGLDLGFEGEFDILEKSLNKEIHPDWIQSEPKDGWIRLNQLPFQLSFANDISEYTRIVWNNNFSPRGSGSESSVFQTQSVVDLVKGHKAGKKVFPKADIVIGGFPCTDFSSCGKRLGFNSSRSHNGTRLSVPSEKNRGKLYIQMMEVIRAVRPLAFVAENVGGLNTMDGVRAKIEEDFRNVGEGYVLADIPILNVANYGVPQTRSRIIFMGFRKDLLKSKRKSPEEMLKELRPCPRETHIDYGKFFFHNEILLPWVTSGDAFRGLDEPNESSDPSQKNLSGAKWYGKGHQGDVEVIFDRPAPTIRAEHHGNIEFRRLAREHGGVNFKELDLGLPERRLTVRECARLQTFPDDFKFVQKGVAATQAYRMIGNAVPPLFAYHLASRLAHVLGKLL